MSENTNPDNTSNNQTGEGGSAGGTPRDTSANATPNAPPGAQGRGNRNRGNRNRRHGHRRADSPSTSTDTGGTLVAGFPGISKIQAPSEGGSKRKMDETLEKIQSTVIASWTYGTDVASVIDTLEYPELDEPDEPDANCSRKESMRFDALYKDYLERESFLDENMKRLAHTVLQFCTPVLKGKLQQYEGYEAAKQDGDVVWLLEKIRDIVYKVDHSKPKELSVDDALQAIVQYRQSSDMSVSDYVKRLMAHVKVYESMVGTFGMTEKAYEDLKKKAEEDTESTLSTEDLFVKLKGEHREKAVAMAIIKRSDDRRFKRLKDQLLTDYSLGHDKYPKTVDAAILALNSQGTVVRGNQFLQERQRDADAPVRAGRDGTTLQDNRVCFRCRHRGHIVPNCPDAPDGDGSGTREDRA